MVKTLNTPNNSLNSQSKDSSHLNQLKTIFQYLQNNVATASMVADATGIYQKNICRYKRDLEKAGRIWELEKKRCEKTGFKAWYLTTNPHKAPKNSTTQLNLFNHGTENKF
jgi:hypothetical protein